MSNNPGVNLINDIKNGNEKALTKVYKKVYTQMQKYGNSIGAIDAEIEEAVQDAFEVFYRQILADQLELNCTVETYVISIARNIFLANERQRNKVLDSQEPELDVLLTDDEEIQALIEDKKHQLYMSEFKKLARDCRRVLSFTLKGFSLREITERMEYSSEDYTKTKRARCRNYLIEKIKENPLYEKLKNSTTEDIELFIWGDDHSTKNGIRRRDKDKQ